MRRSATSRPLGGPRYVRSPELTGGKEDAKEERQRQNDLAERRNQAEATLMGRMAQDRLQLAVRGYTDDQLAAYNAERKAVRDERIAQLEAELDHLDPARARVKAQRSREAQDAVTLARARAAGQDEYMRREVQRFDARQADRGAELARKRQDELSRLAAAGWINPDHPEISR